MTLGLCPDCRVFPYRKLVTFQVKLDWYVTLLLTGKYVFIRDQFGLLSPLLQIQVEANVFVMNFVVVLQSPESPDL